MVGFYLHAHAVEIVIGDLPTQGRFTKRRGVSQAALFGARHDPFHRAMQGLRRRFGHARIRDSERHQVRVIDAFVHADHQWTTIQADRLTVRRWGRVDQRVAGPVAYVKSRLRARFYVPLPFELDVGLADSWDADARAVAHLAKRGQPVTRAKRTSVDNFAN